MPSADRRPKPGRTHLLGRITTSTPPGRLLPPADGCTTAVCGLMEQCSNICSLRLTVRRMPRSAPPGENTFRPTTPPVLLGEYPTPLLDIGERVYCKYRRRRCRVTSFTTAPIPWPRCA